ncbi:MAG: hypothetical protein ACP5IZ_02095 [Thermoprotei archaeon]
MLELESIKALSRTELKVLRFLSKKPEGADVEEIARAVRCSMKSLYFTLRFLSMNGWIRVEHLKNQKVGRPKNIYVLNKSISKILEESQGGCSLQGLNRVRVLDLSGCEYPFCLIRLRRVIKTLNYNEMLMVKTDDDWIIDQLITTARSKGLRLSCVDKEDENIYKLIFRWR